jgi:hypothetical protein
MNKLLPLILLYTSFGCHADPRDVEGDWQFVGHGVALNKCSQLNEELQPKNYNNRKYAYKLWLGGYFTALNMLSKNQVLRETNLEGFYQELEQSCKKYPGVYIGTLVSELSTPYLEEALKSESPNK